MRIPKWPHTGSVSRSSRDANFAYLQAMWNGRLQLQAHERMGFAQSFYIFICTHVESQLFVLIDLRLESIEKFARKAMHNLGSELAIATKEPVHIGIKEPDSSHAFYSIDKMIDRTYHDLRNAPVNKLMDIYDSVFPIPITRLIGEELRKDLKAVTTTRNLFAHGRRIGIELEGPIGSQQADFDSATLKLAAERLRIVGLLSQITPTSFRDYHAWESSLFTDDALLHFYEKIAEIDNKLRGAPCSSWEREKISKMLPLPTLAKVQS